MSFHIGQRVVCVNDENIPWPGIDPAAPAIANFISAGSVYVVRKVSNRRFSLVWLRGINRGGGEWVDSGFFAHRFRPVENTDISIFTAMLAPSPKQKVRA